MNFKWTQHDVQNKHATHVKLVEFMLVCVSNALRTGVSQTDRRIRFDCRENVNRSRRRTEVQDIERVTAESAWYFVCIRQCN